MTDPIIPGFQGRRGPRGRQGVEGNEGVEGIQGVLGTPGIIGPPGELHPRAAEIEQVRQDMARAAKSLRWMLLVLVALIVAIWLTNYSGRWETVHAQRIGCERGKLDRTASAKAFRAQSNYLNGVLDAASVKQDVKTAAKVNQDTQNRTATDLESRTGKRLNCTTAFAAPSLLPLP